MISYRKITALFLLYQFLVHFLKNIYIHVCTLFKQNTMYSLTGSLGFKKFNSTNHVSVSFLNLLNKYLDNNFFVRGVFIDLLKAFDNVHHDDFLAKLDHYGIHGQANSWLQFFLSIRKQNVHISGYPSDIKDVLCSVFQGSILDALLFLAYISDLLSAFS